MVSALRPIDAQGASEDLEAVSAMVQLSAAASGHAAARLRLGSLRQMVIVGLDQKLALLVIGELMLGILAPTTTDLGEVLGR